MSDFDIDGALVELIELALCGNQAGAIDVSNEIQRQYESAIASMQGEAVGYASEESVKTASNGGDAIFGRELADLRPVALFTYPPSAASKIAEQESRIKELEKQLEVAWKDVVSVDRLNKVIDSWINTASSYGFSGDAENYENLRKDIMSCSQL